MAAGRKTGGRDIKKGQVLNPHGRPKLPEDVKQLRQISSIEVTRILTKLITMPFHALITFVNNKNGNALEMMVARILLEGIKQGDVARLEFFLNRLIGKTPDNINISGNYHIGVVDFIERLKEARKTEEG